MKAKKGLIFNPFGIGDVLFSTPLIRNIKDNYSDITLSYMCNRRVLPLIKNNPLIDKTFIFEKDDFRASLKASKLGFLKLVGGFFSSLRKEEFDFVIDLSLNAQYGFFLKAAGIKIRVGYNFKGRGRFLTHKVDIPFGYDKKHVVLYYLDLLRFIGISPQERKMEIFLTDVQVQKAKKLLLKSGISFSSHFIGIFCGGGASWAGDAYKKRLPQDKFSILIDRLSQEGNEIVLLGSLKERELAEEVIKGSKSKPLNLAGKLSLIDTAAVIKHTDLIVTNDGGPLHIAAALGIKTVSIFGPVDDKVYGPFPNDRRKNIVVKKDLECRPCYRAFKMPKCIYDYACLRKISPEEIFLAAEELLG